MLQSLFSELTLFNTIFLLVACFAAAFIDAIAGGGGLISLPAFLSIGLPPHIALGTNKLAAFFSTSGSAYKFFSSGKINWNLVKYLIPFSFLGAVIGVKSVILIEPTYLYPIVFVLLVFVFVYTLKNKKLGNIDNFEKANKKSLAYGIMLAFVLGFYDGFLGPGTGSFIIFGLIKIFKLDFIKASGNSKFLNLASNVASVMTFLYYGKINYLFALMAGSTMLIGANLGARTAVSYGTSFIRPVFLIMTSIVTIKILFTII